jgi:hypothetical protein
VLVALFVVFLARYFLSHSNLAQDVKGMGKRTSKVTVSYLGSVPMEASLTDLVPAKDRWSIRYKENWLYEAVRPERVNRVSMSHNGKSKVVLSPSAVRIVEGEREATFVDTNGSVIWSAITGDIVIVSNNGKNIASTNVIGGKDICFYDVRKSTDPIAVVPNYGTNIFTDNGEYFLSVGERMALYTSQGILIWEKDIEAAGLSSVAISANGVSIGIINSTRLAELKARSRSRPGGTVQEKKVARTSAPSVEQQMKQENTVGRQDQRLEHKKAVADEPSAKGDGESYVSFFKGDGTFINRVSLPYARMGKLTFSADGKYAAAVCDSTVLLFDARTGSWLWKYEFPSVYWWTTCMALSRDGEVLCVAVLSNRGDPFSPPHLCLLDKKGNKVADFELEKPSSQQPGPVVTFSEDEKHVLVATRTSKYCFRVSTAR